MGQGTRVIVDIRRKSGIAGSYYFIVTMRDEQNKTDKRLTFNFGSHNSADVEALSNGSVATIVGRGSSGARFHDPDATES